MQNSRYNGSQATRGALGFSPAPISAPHACSARQTSVILHRLARVTRRTEALPIRPIPEHAHITAMRTNVIHVRCSSAAPHAPRERGKVLDARQRPRPPIPPPRCARPARWRRNRRMHRAQPRAVLAAGHGAGGQWARRHLLRARGRMRAHARRTLRRRGPALAHGTEHRPPRPRPIPFNAAGLYVGL